MIAKNPVAGDAAGPARVQDINKIAIYRDTVRKLPSCAQDLLKGDIPAVGS